MMKTRKGTLGLGAIGASLLMAIGGIWLAGHGDTAGDRAEKAAATRPGKPAELSHLTAQMDIVRARGAGLADDVAQLKAEMAELGDPQPGSGGDGSDEAASLSPEEADARADERLLAQLQLFEDQLLEEGSDATWAPSAVQMLHQSFAREMLARVHLDHAECATSFCRLEVSFESAEDSDKGLRMALQDLPWPSEGFVHVSGGGDPEALVYVAREGHFLPRAELE